MCAVPAAGPGAKLTALLCYAVALAGAGALAARVFLLGLGFLPVPSLLPGARPWLLDLGWLAAFGLQHSGMARAGFKRRLRPIVPPRLERSLYAAAAGLVLLGLALTWQPLSGEPLWAGPAWLAAVPLAAGAGLAAINLRFDHAGLFGLRQAWEREPAPEELLVLGPYRYVRHPLMACLLVMFWVQPVMTPTLTVLSGGLTAYVALGLVLEERDLLRQFGPAYAAYRRRVPALVPWRPPAEPARYPAADSKGGP
jgi:protein-S-isoprenylcysteine O-methyltransferase Ste14